MSKPGFRIERDGPGYVVLRGENRVSGINNKNVAEAMLSRLELEDQKTFKPRKCLCCDTVFLSEGPHHRLCNHHRATVGGHDRQMVG